MILSLLFSISAAFAAGPGAPDCQGLVTNALSRKEQILAQVEERAGGPVKVHYQPESGDYDEFRLMKENGGELASLSARILGSHLLVAQIDVGPAYRRLGISELLLMEALERHPQTRSISTMLMETNWDVLRKALAEGKECVEALKSTPSYRIRARLGFSVVSRPDCGPIPGYTAEKP